MRYEIFEGDLSDEAYTKLSTGTVALDIETTGLDRLKDSIELVQLYNSHFDVVYMVRKLQNPKNILAILEDKRITKLIHYAMFDMIFFMRDYNIEPKNIRCTRIAAAMYDKQRALLKNPKDGKVSFSLANLVHYFFDVKLDKSIAVSNWRDELSGEQIEYAMNDVLYLEKLYTTLMKLMPIRIRTLYKNVCDALPTQGELYLEGYGDMYKR